MKKKLVLIPVLFFILFLLTSCSGTPPKINRITWNRVVELSGKKVISEGLSFFVSAEDEDGKGDIDSVYLINDSFELFWKLAPETWVEKSVDSQLWIGSNSIKMQDLSRMPSGTYRVVVIDKGGDRDQREFFLTPFTVSKNLPSLKLLDGAVLRVSSPFDENYLWLRDSAGRTVKVLSIVSGDTSLDIALRDIKEKIASYVLYSFDAASNCGYTVSVPAE